MIRNRGFTAACLTILFLSAVFFSAILYVPQLMEKILGYSALKAGVGMLPMLGTFGLVAFLSGRLTDRVGMRRVILAGTTLLAAGRCCSRSSTPTPSTGSWCPAWSRPASGRACSTRP